MIARMKRFTIVATAASRERALERLRELGCGHLDFSGADSAAVTAARGALEDAASALRIIAKAAAEHKGADLSATVHNGELFAAGERASLTVVKRSELVAAVLEADAARRGAIENASRIGRQIAVQLPFGDFDPALAARLENAGRALRLFKVTASAAEAFRAALPEGTLVETVGSNGNTAAVAVIFDGAAVPVKLPGVEPVAMPSERLSSLRARLAEAERLADSIGIDLARAASRSAEISSMEPALQERLDFEFARERLETAGAIAWISGWTPESEVPALRAAAVSECWGLLTRDPEEGETPPVLIRPPKLFRPVKALFEGLGIAPAYNEADVSVPFLAYFSLFFAMLVGDGGYGAIILALTLAGWKKTAVKGAKRPVMVRSWLTLLTVFSIATIVWGLLSNTWFGAGLPFAKDWPSVKWLGEASYSNMMLLCFTIGVSHLMIARIWNGISAINDRSCLAQFGWAGIVFFMYWVTCSIVGIFSGIPPCLYALFGLSLALVFLFTLKPCELKTRGIELGMLPLNIMSVLGDIISYVRLFAVGLASVKVAENFNSMAVGMLSMSDSIWLKPLLVLAMVAILLLGHALNFAMAGLSILVHAVRLNTLEFSNHKGISWAGEQFRPFRRRR